MYGNRRGTGFFVVCLTTYLRLYSVDDSMNSEEEKKKF